MNGCRILLIDDEWDVVPGAPQHGRGDLLFTDGEGTYAVVEVKHLDVGATGPTARVKRTKKRRQVEAQALTYAAHATARFRGPAVAFTYTNEHGFRPARAPSSSTEEDDDA